MDYCLYFSEVGDFSAYFFFRDTPSNMSKVCSNKDSELFSE